MTPENNIFARDGFFWWIGVVEDRMDPLKLGRVRVRILGYHLDNKAVLPTEDLPWALPMQPITSAAISGVGSAPVGPVEGTWVLGFFADGKDCQQPVIMGTIGGLPARGPSCEDNARTAQQNQPGVLRDSNGQPVLDENGNTQPVQPQATNPPATSSVAAAAQAITGTLPPLTTTDIDALMAAIAFKESSSVAGGAQNYSTTNQLGYVGKYQFGAPALQTVGFVRNPSPMRARANSELNDASVWTGKLGVSSIEDWRANKNNCQETAMFALLQNNYRSLTPTTIDPSGEKGQAAGYLAVAHLLGPGGARNLKNGRSGADGNGVDAKTYYELGSRAVGGGGAPVFAEPAPSSSRSSNTRQPSSTASPYGALNDPKLGQPEPYADPNSVYPQCDYTNRPDTNKLATADSSDTTIVAQKRDRRVEKIDRANTDAGWSEPTPAYCARYPYNHVIESESGHVIEMDDTPGAERLHIYHRTGTYIEIDRDGTLRQRVQGDNYEVFIRNNRIYTQGRWDLTVDGAARAMVKDALDLEVWGETNVNIKNNANINISGAANVSVKEDLKFRARNIYLESDQNLHVKTGSSLFFAVGGAEHHKVSSNFNVDASNIHLNSGRSSTGQGSGLATPTAVRTPTGSAPEYLKIDECTPEERSGVQNDAGENENFAQEQVAAGVYKPEQVEQGRAQVAAGCSRSDTRAPNIVTQQRIDATEFNSYTDFSDAIRLSRSFTLGDVTTRVALVSEQNAVTAQRGLSKQQIVSNLKGLCCNVLDPIRARYPNMFVTNAFRIGSGSSQHELGEAADLQFRGAAASEYYDIALWIRDNVAYDQLLLEYKTTGSGQPWIHVSHKLSGNRAAGGNKVMTFMNHATVKPFLCDLSKS